VPNEAGYHNLRGDILQGLLRLDEAQEAYEEALRRDPKLAAAQLNLDLTRKILVEIGTDEQIKPAILAELYAALLKQGRRNAAQSLESQFGVDKQRLVKLWRDAFDKRGMRAQRFETNPDNSITVDFSKVPQPDVRKLRDLPVSGLTLDDTKMTDIVGLKGLHLESLSLGHTFVQDLTPLAGMPLRTLNIESTPIVDLKPLQELPVENLRLNNTRVANLAPLAGLKIEQLSLAGCRTVRDLTPLRGMPLQTLNLSRTNVNNLVPLTESPLRELNLEGCLALTDLKPLMEIMTLESVVIPLQCRDLGFLRSHPSLKRISYKKLTESAVDFWKEYDAAKAASGAPQADAAPAAKADAAPAAKAGR
jgi:tetratricopeptide (TPR) repeat protein